DENSAKLRFDLEIEQFEPGRAARFGFVQVDHRGPGPLSAVWLVLRPVGLIDVEEIRVFPEALALLIALPLEGLAVDLVHAEQVGDAAVNLDDQRVKGVEIAAVAGSDVAVLFLIVERRRIAALVDLLAHYPAGLGIQEILADVELDRLFRAPAQPPQPRRGVEILADAPGDSRTQVRPLLRE